MAVKNKKLPDAVKAADVAEIVAYAVNNAGCNSIQITGGSTYNGKTESKHITGTLKEAASYLAERGILPTASVWMPMGKPVQGSMQAPDIAYYQRVKNLLAELYQKYNLESPASRGLNVCLERDIWNYSC